MPPTGRKLWFSRQAASFLESCIDLMDAWRTCASILLDPAIDRHFKFSLDDFNYPGSRVLLDGSWRIVYRVNDHGDVFIESIMRHKDLEFGGFPLRSTP